MIERALLIIIIFGVGFTLYQLWRWYHLRNISHDIAEFTFGKPAIVLFTADFCQPCKLQQQPAIQRLLQEINTVQYISVDVEAQPDIAQKWGVMSLPTTFILDKTGKPREVNYGVTTTDKLKRQLERLQHGSSR